MLKTLLSIDFDFFVPEDPMWDIGHQENELFHRQIWYCRSQLRHKMKATKDLDGFWNKLPFNYKTQELFVSESHCEVYAKLPVPCNVILFDAHHDAYLKFFKEERSKGEPTVSCGTWLSHSLTDMIVMRVLWVVPDWYHKFHKLDPLKQIPARFQKHFDVTSLKKLPWKLGQIGITDIDVAHLCRSGCWVAPWLDETFIEFAHSGPFSEVTTICEREPLTKRWGPEDYKILDEHGKQLQEFKKKQLNKLMEEEGLK
jgi:hypothetical protein